MNRRVFIASFLFASTLLWVATGRPHPPQEDGESNLTREQKEEFLKTAEIIRKTGIGTGVPNAIRATLSDGKMTHDAQIQKVDMFRSKYETPAGTERNFTDSWKYNVAVYRLDKIMNLGFVPVSVERRVDGKKAAMTWWIDDVQMDEGQRLKRKLEPPDNDRWTKQIYNVRVLDQLIFNMDRNGGNLLITNDWQVWAIDHTRAFRLFKQLRNAKNLIRCDRWILAELRKLDYDTLATELIPYLNKPQIQTMLARRDRIVKLFDKKIAERGEEAILFDLLN